MVKKKKVAAALGQRELANSVLLKSVELEPIMEILQEGVVKEFEKGQVLIEVKQSNRCLYMILAGRVSIQLEPHLSPIAILGPGDVVGELSLIDGQLTTAYVMAEASTRVLELEEQTMSSLLYASPGVARNLLFIMARRLRHLTNQELRREHAHYAIRQYAQDTVIDTLTGLYNRRWLDSMLVRELNRSERDHRPLALLLISIDAFEEETENHGDLASEHILNTIASVLQEITRPGEMLARYGKDEFLTLLPDTDASTGLEVGERLRQAIHQAELPGLDRDSSADVTVSIGVAELAAGDTADTLLSAVDSALHEARQGGGNRVFQLPRPS